jgi:hypothetical protein
MIAEAAITPINASVPHRSKTGGIAERRKPARENDRGRERPNRDREPACDAEPGRESRLRPTPCCTTQRSAERQRGLEDSDPDESGRRDDRGRLSLKEAHGYGSHGTLALA